MTTMLANILAEDDGGWLNFVWIAVLLIFAGLGKLADWLSKRHAGEKADRKAAQRRQTREAKREESPYDLQPQRKPRQTPPAIRQRAAATPPPRHPGGLISVDVQHTHVDDELKRQQARLRNEEAQRQKRLAKLKALKKQQQAADRLESADQEAAQASQKGPGIRIDLTNNRRALAAVVMREILSQPKALRTEPEPWEV